MMNELRFALRRLRQSPGFTLIAVVTLALGIGANTAIFSVVNGVLLRPLPYAQPAELVTLKSQQSSPELADIAAQSKSFESVGGVGIQAAAYAGATEPIELELGLVGGDFFRVLGTRAALGRTLTAEDDRFGGAQIAVLTHELWQTQFGAAIWKVDPLIPVTSVRPMSEVLAVSLAEQRFNTLLLAIFAGVALLLAGVGLYGVRAFLVTQRTREIGIRVALGAQARDVMRLVLRQGMTLSGIGVVAGICLSLAATRVLAGLLYGISPTDPVTFIALAALLVFVALIACVVPARRAMRVDPIIALRHE